MTRGHLPVWNRRVVLAVGAISVAGCVLVAVGGFAQTGAPSEAAAPVQAKILAKGPDVLVFSLSSPGNYGSSGGFVGYALGTVSCNRGDAPLNWCDQGSGCAPGAGPEDHPVIAQNLYRIKNGRMDQVGMSWLKHGFLSTNSNTTGCRESSSTGSCQSPPAGSNQLGIGCTDPYGSSLNGSRPLGPRSQVNGTTAVFPFPPTSPGGPYTVYDQRIKVATTDVDSSQNPGATYFAEGQYFASDDAAAGNSLNNASYRQVTVGAGPSYNLAYTGSFFEGQSAINAWRTSDPTVVIANVDVAGSIVERFEVARKVTDLGDGLWHYEYAVRNHNSDRNARGFTVAFPGATTFTNIGFHDVEHHSGEPYATTDWAQTRRRTRCRGRPTPSPPTPTPTRCASPRCSTSGSTPTDSPTATSTRPSSTPSTSSGPATRRRCSSRASTGCSTTASRAATTTPGTGGQLIAARGARQRDRFVAALLAMTDSLVRALGAASRRREPRRRAPSGVGERARRRAVLPPAGAAWLTTRPRGRPLYLRRLHRRKLLGGWEALDAVARQAMLGARHQRAAVGGDEVPIDLGEQVLSLGALRVVEGDEVGLG